MPKEKPHNNGQWTSARFRGFIKSALRKAQWPPKYQCIRDAYVEDGINPATGRKCKFHECASCGKLFMQKQMTADHIEPVVCPERGFVDWNTLIDRLYVEAGGFQALCADCHKAKTDKENAIRKANK